MSMEGQQNILPQDVAFMGTLHIMLAVALQAVQQYEYAEGKLPTMQELREQTLQLADPQELFYTLLLGGAYSEAKSGGYEQFRRDYELVLNRFLALYELDQSVIKVSALFVEDVSPFQRMRFLELLRSAYIAIKRGMQWAPEEENERKMYEIFLALFRESEKE